VLKVIEDQQEVFVAQGIGKGPRKVLARLLRHIQDFGDGGRDEGRISQGSEVDEEDPIAEVVEERIADLQGQAGLARPITVSEAKISPTPAIEQSRAARFNAPPR
jgi:hypothetical protein